LAIPAADASERVAGQTPDVPQKTA
jgi:hypothetical protein